MNTERERRIYQLLDIALKLEPPQRRAYLDQQCARDEALRRELEELLVAAECAAASRYLETPAAIKFAGALAAEQKAQLASGPPLIFKGRYQVIKEIGRGGCGVVYLACDLDLHARLVVVKVLLPAVGPHSQKINEYAKRKFHGEIDALTRFRHPHIVGILDQGLTPDGEPFFVMDLIEGDSLRTAMNAGRMAFPDIARIGEQTGAALSYAHERGVFHRDLKPGNIMLRKADGFVIVIDFGIATVKEWPHKTRGGPSTWPSGTYEYMAPEQFRGEPSAASDNWAQGVIAYEMLTGRLPFVVPLDDEGRIKLREFYELLQAGVQLHPKDLRPDLPAAAQAAILRALSFDPQDRFARACDFGQALAQALTSASPPPSASAPTEIIAPEAVTEETTEVFAQVATPPPEVVISYDSHDLRHAHQLAGHLRQAGVSFWMADHGHEVTRNDRSESVRAIKQSKLLLLLCSDAALRSRSVKQELQTAWMSERPFLPLLVEPMDFPAQTAYWLEGKSSIELVTAPESDLQHDWLPKVLRTLDAAGITCPRADRGAFATAPIVTPTRLDRSLQSLRSIARCTDQIWPLPAEGQQRRAARSGVRGLGAPQDDVQHGYRLGSRVRLAIESTRAGYLLLLDEGPEKIIYCLCPSHFAPETRLQADYSELPQKRSRYDSFVVTGKPGREHLLAIISDEPLGLDWLPSDPKVPARVLKQADVERLLARLREIEVTQWTALSTYFDVID